MMSPSPLLFLSLPLLGALAQNPSGPWPAAPSGPDAPAPGAPICGKGFTYCGYILRDHQSFPESEIVKAYCAGNVANCANGKTKSDPIQALYVCVPPGGAAVTPGGGLANISDYTQQHHVQDRVDGEKSTSFFTSSGAPTSAAQGDDGGACAATAGNRIELLCACGGQCLNPTVDHIGRCDVPCS
ncbi:hypothetical protein B0T18DRAFT_424893 [Schizothecium vesticola]|uniref:Uncharacterized protein n=1 Tax=Schizothecium vesticola TaxID=314040 RepID=A0AA40KD54_9PEZI|nr:hypothetical protein B0T18DRAFT_424893 [Schizothecium vesticola]